MAPLQSELPALWLFLGAYLHQDWRDDYDSTEQAFRDFLTSEPRQSGTACDELRILLDSDRDEPALVGMLREAGSFYVPGSDGLTTREWLARLLTLCVESSES